MTLEVVGAEDGFLEVEMILEAEMIPVDGEMMIAAVATTGAGTTMTDYWH